MAGSWEILDNPSVLVGVLHVETTTVAWSLGLRNLQIPRGGVMGVTGMPFDHARNTLCMRALDLGMDYLFFLDSDVIPPPDAVRRLLRHRLPIVSGVYHRRSPPHGLPVAIKGPTWVQSYPPDTLMEVDFVGAGCLLISADVLRSFPPVGPDRGKHWFDWRVDMKGVRDAQGKPLLQDGECLSEDFAFCLQARRCGHKVMLDTGVQCRHVGFAQATYMNLQPCEHA